MPDRKSKIRLLSRTIPYSTLRPSISSELKVSLDLSAPPWFYEMTHGPQRQMDQMENRFAQLKTSAEAMNQQITQLKASSETMNQQISQLKSKNEARERELDEQLRYEVAKRFCRGLADMLCNKLDKLPGLASELHKPGLRFLPNAFVLLTYYHHYNDDTLPDIFYEFSERVHQMNVTALEAITPGARTTLTALDALESGPHGDEFKLLIYLWAVRTGLDKRWNMLTFPIPDFAFALEVLRQHIPDPDHQALMERILPSLVEEVAFSEHIKYFVH